MIDLVREVKRLGLEADPDVKALQEQVDRKREIRTKEIQAKFALKPQMLRSIKEKVEQAGGQVTTDDYGQITFQEYLKVFVAVVQLQIEYNRDSLPAQKEERRALLKAKKENEYQVKCQEQQTTNQIIRSNFTTEAVKQFGLRLDVYNQMTKHYQEEPTTRKVLTEAGQQVERQERSKQGGGMQIEKA